MHRIARLAAATFVLAGGYIHFDLWRDGYRAIEYIGPLFVANAVVSVLLVVALLLRPDARVVVAGVVFSVGSLIALGLSRTIGLLGFTERGWSDMAVQATTAEIGAIVAIALVAVARRRPTPALVLDKAGAHRQP
jgi:hypothetical protein